MQFFMRFLILIWICVNSHATNVPTSTATSSATGTNVPEVNKIKLEHNDSPAVAVENKIRDKRQMYIPTSTPVFFDGQQQFPQQQQTGGLQGIPIIGTLVSGLPILGGGQNLLSGLPGNLGTGLSGLTSGLTSTLGNLGGGLGNLGQLGNIGGLGNLGLLGGSAPSTTVPAACPAHQKLSCRCEPLVPVKPLGVRKDDVIEIINQNIKRNMDGTTEMIVQLNNGVIMYQKANNLQVNEMEGYYSLKITEDRYLTIYYTVNDLDYTVKADVNTEPPRTNFQIQNEHQNLLGSF